MYCYCYRSLHLQKMFAGVECQLLMRALSCEFSFVSLMLCLLISLHSSSATVVLVVAPTLKNDSLLFFQYTMYLLWHESISTFVFYSVTYSYVRIKFMNCEILYSQL